MSLTCRPIFVSNFWTGSKISLSDIFGNYEDKLCNLCNIFHGFQPRRRTDEFSTTWNFVFARGNYLQMQLHVFDNTCTVLGTFFPAQCHESSSKFYVNWWFLTGGQQKKFRWATAWFQYKEKYVLRKSRSKVLLQGPQCQIFRLPNNNTIMDLQNTKQVFIFDLD